MVMNDFPSLGALVMRTGLWDSWATLQVATKKKWFGQRFYWIDPAVVATVVMFQKLYKNHSREFKTLP